jgi:diguanylate cyclase (GGDEF)-like protein
MLGTPPATNCHRRRHLVPHWSYVVRSHPLGIVPLVTRDHPLVGEFAQRRANAARIRGVGSGAWRHKTGFLLAVLIFSLGVGFCTAAAITVRGGVFEPPSASAAATVERGISRGSDRTGFIAFAGGALLAMALAALVMWFVLLDRLFILYAALFGLQSLCVAYLSGGDFHSPLLAYARPLASLCWNTPLALSAAVACLLARNIADLQHFQPRVYQTFGGLAVAFVVLACASATGMLGFGPLTPRMGDLMLLGTAVFTIMVAYLGWLRGARAEGWLLIAWTLLEELTTVTAARLMHADGDIAERLLNVGLPLSVIAAAVLTALAIAEPLRAHRHALTDAERRAQIDALTGVFNRHALFERLESVCVRARAQDLPVTLLFIDLDHFKDVNDSFGHAAGDACLRAVVGPIQAELRLSDVFGRYGGEEFVVILSNADTVMAHSVAERIRERVAATAVEGFGVPIRLTCSIGVAGSDALGVWGEQLIARADRAVYGAKNAGRNRVEVAVPLPA